MAMWSSSSGEHPRQSASTQHSFHSAAPIRPNSGAQAHAEPAFNAASASAEELSALPWSDAFDVRRMVAIPASHSVDASGDASSVDEFCVYTAGPPAAAGSSSAPPPFVTLLLHGGGHTSLAWACVTSHIKSAVHVLALDLRGHGHTRTQRDADLSMERMVADVVGVLRAVYPSAVPPLLIIGHSLGGALAVHLTASHQLPVCGLVMVDLVEGSAVDSLTHMRSVVLSRPPFFPSPQAAVQWSLRVGAMRNARSARFSLPDQLEASEVRVGEKTQAEAQGQGETQGQGDDADSPPPPAVTDADAASTGIPCYRWRTDLLASEPFWSTWFAGLSALFLSCPLPKLLLLASAERLDPPMMVAHMQGKLQVDVVAHAGHSVQEDQPADTARRILGFVARHKMQHMADTWAKTGAAQAAKAAAAAAGVHAQSGTTVSAPPPAPAASAPTSSRHTSALPPVPLFHDK